MLTALTGNNPIFSFWNILVFSYYQLLTVVLGYLLFPSRKYFVGKPVLNLFAFWLWGFNLLTVTAVLLVSAGRLDRNSWITLNIILLIFVLFKIKAIKGLGGIISESYYLLKEGIRSYPFVFSLLGGIILIAFFSCLVPPTKVDELTYGIFYTKAIAREGRFPLLYTPYEVLSYLAVPIYNIWFYIAKAEYALSLNSLFYFLFSVFLIFSWARERFKADVAVLSVMITSFCLLKAISNIAPGDNSLNILLNFMFMVLIYELSQGYKQDAWSFPAGDYACGVFLLHVVFFTSAAVKFTSLLLTIPLMILFYSFNYRRLYKIKRDLLWAMGLPCIIMIAFFIKSFLLYGNFLFPFGINFLGAGPFDPKALSEGIKRVILKSELGINRDFTGLLKSPFLYLKSYLLFLNPLAWFFMVLGFVTLLKKNLYWIIIGLGICYVCAFFLLTHNFIRFYLGALDFLVILGLAWFLGGLSDTQRFNRLATVKKISTLIAAAIAIGVFLYSRQFLAFFFFSQNRDRFIAERTACYNTALWVNAHLPKAGLMIAPCRERYYFDIRTEYPEPTFLGKDPAIVRDSRDFYTFLKEKGVTHLMFIPQETAEEEKNAYASFCQNQDFCQLVYEDKNEIIFSGRWTKPSFGKVQIYRIK